MGFAFFDEGDLLDVAVVSVDIFVKVLRRFGVLIVDPLASDSGEVIVSSISANFAASRLIRVDRRGVPKASPS
jgi:hypothetical protein